MRRLNRPARRALARSTQPNDHVNAYYFHSLRHLRQATDLHARSRNVEQRLRVLDQKMVMIGDVGIKLGFSTVDGYFPKQTRLRELMQRIIDRRQ